MEKQKKTLNKKIVFISSYPKSGNTWVRILIRAIINENKGIFKFKDLENVKLFSQFVYFSHFENIKFQPNGNLDFDFVVNNWMNAQKRINKNSNKARFFKTHSIRGIINGNFFTNEEVCLGFIYIIRDPRDIAISLSKHMGITIDNAIEIILFNNKFVTTAFKVNEPVCTWQNHLESWINFENVPRLIIKYEDILEGRKKILNQIINFLKNQLNLEIDVKKEVARNILKSTSFSILQKLEKDKGFKEASINSNFFRKGKSNQWKKILTNSQIRLIEKELYKPMKELKYL